MMFLFNSKDTTGNIEGSEIQDSKVGELTQGLRSYKSVLPHFENDLCWGCLEEGRFKNVFKRHSHNGGDEIYADMILHCFSMQVRDEGDSSQYYICDICIERLREANKFKIQLENAREFLQRSKSIEVLLRNKSNEDVEPESDGTDDERIVDNVITGEGKLEAGCSEFVECGVEMDINSFKEEVVDWRKSSPGIGSSSKQNDIQENNENTSRSSSKDRQYDDLKTENISENSTVIVDDSSQEVLDISPTRRNVLTANEQKILVKWMISIHKAGYIFTTDDIRSCIDNMLRNLKRSPFTGTKSWETWLQKFISRNRNVSKLFAENVPFDSDRVSEACLWEWYQKVQDTDHNSDCLKIEENPTGDVSEKISNIVDSIKNALRQSQIKRKSGSNTADEDNRMRNKRIAVKKALELINMGLTIVQVNKLTGISVSTLNYYKHGRYKRKKKEILTSKEEKILVKWVMTNFKYPVKKIQFLRSLIIFLNRMKRKHNLITRRQGYCFLKRFMNRHPEVKPYFVWVPRKNGRRNSESSGCEYTFEKDMPSSVNDTDVVIDSKDVYKSCSLLSDVKNDSGDDEDFYILENLPTNENSREYDLRNTDDEEGLVENEGKKNNKPKEDLTNWFCRMMSLLNNVQQESSSNYVIRKRKFENGNIPRQKTIRNFYKYVPENMSMDNSESAEEGEIIDESINYTDDKTTMGVAETEGDTFADIITKHKKVIFLIGKPKASQDAEIDSKEEAGNIEQYIIEDNRDSSEEYSQESLEEAVELVKSGLCVIKASVVCGVPLAVLKYKVLKTTNFPLLD